MYDERTWLSAMEMYEYDDIVDIDTDRSLVNLGWACEGLERISASSRGITL
jgi:hypothetical protein